MHAAATAGDDDKDIGIIVVHLYVVSALGKDNYSLSPGLK